jgi:uncharacterized protein YhaN
MRFRRLDLLAHGPFTKAHIDLSQGNYGLHIVFGLNEAGKSSSLRALTNFLFGFPSRTSDDFLHNYGLLRVGGLLENRDGESLYCIRRKGQSNTLRDAEDSSAISEPQWQRIMPEITRDQFTSMFGLTHESLRQGGDDIARGGGKSGETIFSSASGLIGLRDKQKNLTEWIDALFRPRGASKLKEALDQYNQIRDEQKNATVSVEFWEQRQVALLQAQSKFDKIQQDFDDKQREYNRFQRIQASLGNAKQWEQDRVRLQHLSDAVLVAEDFGRRAIELQNSERFLERQLEDDHSSLLKLRKEASELGERNPILDFESQIDRLQKRFGEYDKAQLDLPNLKIEFSKLQEQASDILLAMGRPTALDDQAIERWRIPDEHRENIEHLALEFGTLDEKVKARREALEQAKQRTEQRTAPEAIPIVDTLRIAIEQSLNEASLRLAIDETCRKDFAQWHIDSGQWTAAMQRHAMPTMTAESLSVLPLPLITSLVSFDKQDQDLQRRDQTAREKLTSLSEQADRTRLLLRNLESDGAIPTKAQWQSAQHTRDAGWQLIQSKLRGNPPSDHEVSSWIKTLGSDAPLEKAFEQSIDDADAIASQLLDFSDRVAQAQQQRLELSDREREIERTQEGLHQIQQARQAWQLEWHAHWHGLIDDPKSVAEMREWLTQAHQLQNQATNLVSKHREIEEEKKENESRRLALLQTLQATPISLPSDHSLSSLVATARQAIETDRQLRSQVESDQRQREKDEQAAVAEKRNLKAAEELLDAWRVKWAAAMTAIGLSNDAALEQVKRRLKNTSELFQRIKESKSIEKRVAVIERDAISFENDVVQLALQFGIVRDGQSIESVLVRVDRLYDAALKDQQQREQLQLQIDTLEKNISAHQQSLNEVQCELQSMMDLTQCGHVSELYEASERSKERRNCELALRNLESQLLVQADGSALDEFLEEVQSHSQDEIKSCIVRLEEENKNLRQTLLAASQEKSDLEKEVEQLDKQGSAADCASRALGVASKIEDLVREYAVLRLCDAVLTNGIEKFREKNQSPMLKVASHSFSRMTRGRFARLKLDINDKGDQILVGVRETGGEVKVEEMSDGTRDQLYLALRLAALQDWNDRHEPVPLVLDDILVHFDDDRAIASLEQLMELSDHTQVIFFTHHQHLADLAKSQLDSGKVFLHRIESR